MTGAELQNVELPAQAVELASLNEQRATLYGLLSRMFQKEADETLLSNLRTMQFPINTGNDSFDKANWLLASYLAYVWENSLNELAIDYARLFLGNGTNGSLSPFPFESVYTSEKGLTMQDARDQVLDIYRQHGLNKNASWKDSEDHIALEFEFMQYLAQRSTKAFNAGNEKGGWDYMECSQEFLKQHLWNWIPQFCDDILQAAQTDFYKGAAHMTLGVLSMDRELLYEAFPEKCA